MFPCLSRIEKSLKEQGFSVKRADREDLKRIPAVYYEQNVTTKRFGDFGGERRMQRCVRCFFGIFLIWKKE